MSLRDVFNKLGRDELLPLPEDVYASLAAAQVKYKTEYPDAINELTKLVPDVAQISGPLLAAMGKAGGHIGVLIGDARRLPSGGEVAQSIEAFADVHRQVKAFIAGMKQNQRLDRIAVISGKDVFPYLVGMHPFTGLLALRFKAAVETAGGPNQLVRNAKSRGKEARGALGAFFKSAKPSTGRSEVDLGLAAILGPLAPLAIGIATGVRGARAVMKEHSTARRGIKESIETAKLTTSPSSGLGGRPAGFIPPAMGSVMGGFPMSSLMSGAAPSGQAAPSAGSALNMSRQMMIGAIISGMSMFSASQAMRIGWHKRVLDLLEKQAKGPDSKHPMTQIVDWVTRLLGGAASVAGGVGAAVAGGVAGLAAPIVTAGAIVAGVASYEAIKLAKKAKVNYIPQMTNVFDPLSAASAWSSAMGEKVGRSVVKGRGMSEVPTSRIKAPPLRSEGEDIARTEAEANRTQQDSFLKIISAAFASGFDKLREATKAVSDSPRDQARMPYDNPDPLVVSIVDNGLEQ